MDQEPVPLLFTVTPEYDESLVGFLIRVAEANFLGSPHAFIKIVSRRSQQPPSIWDVPTMATLCGCHPDEIVKLFGFESRTSSGEKAWRVGSEWITKPYFVSSRMLSYCPACLAESPHLRSIWELTLYRVCARHQIILLDSCPACGRHTTWMRSHVAHCLCGCSFAEAPSSPAEGFPLLVSVLIEQLLWPDQQHVPHVLPMEITRRLQGLSLEALCKTIWLLGKHLEAPEPKRRHKSSRRKKIESALSVIESAGEVLTHWPDVFWARMEKLRQKDIPLHDGSLILKMFGSVHRYLAEDMHGDEYLFLRNAYERYIRELWRSMNKSTPIIVSPQLELDF